ncbi:hypothetical protein CC1G_04339 [Coprinopsis cinerea okayama7|uniref:PCI domain-containing protein n=1 Tax=Coprinopsis cinerea (strain Okayama-7 / 130 / ATCC MYA-4618 / FGSC 9003) TaxID=240176 RepID=A8N0N6_COPC7|nr:hypothetical protein CC1G_04339 [Coprinopsis cinerea okayama7\|eukprot:XP_001828368.2 hypothetical protein CC1G_04339 [Coprinopsis cinerea okayama7\
MDLGSNFSAKLEPFLLMAKSAKGAAAAKLVQDATSAPGVFVFGELLDLNNIQELAKSEQHAKFYSLLQLFAYKTYQDYLQHKDSLPPLNPAQITKLKHLSIVSLASERRILPYADLLKALDVTTVRELEDLIIDAIYLDILQGKLDQKHEQLEVEYTMGRDVNVEEGGLEAILNALQTWATTTSSVLSTLDTKLQALSNQAQQRQRAQQEYDAELQATLRDVSEKHGHKDREGGGGGGYGSGFGKGVRKMFDRDRENRDREAYEGGGGAFSGQGRTLGGAGPSGGGMGMDIDDPPVDKENVRGGKNRKASQESMSSKPSRKRNKF